MLCLLYCHVFFKTNYNLWRNKKFFIEKYFESAFLIISQILSFAVIKIIEVNINLIHFLNHVLVLKRVRRVMQALRFLEWKWLLCFFRFLFYFLCISDRYLWLISIIAFWITHYNLHCSSVCVFLRSIYLFQELLKWFNQMFHY